MGVDWSAVLEATAAIGGVTIAWVTLHLSRRTEASKAFDAHIKQLAKDEQVPLKDIQADHAARLLQLRDSVDRTEAGMKDIVDLVRELRDKMSVVETKTNLAWQGYEQLALGLAKNMAKILHQPHKAREPIDKLLEGFMNGTLTAEEFIKLKQALVDIAEWLPGKDLGYPVQPWEPTAAGTFLSIIDLVEPSRMAAVGNALHRTHQ